MKILEQKDKSKFIKLKFMNYFIVIMIIPLSPLRISK